MKNLRLVVIAVFSIGALAALGLYLNPAHAAPSYNCTAGPGEQCFSDLFYSDFERFKLLREKVVAMQKNPDTKALELAEKTDQLNGMAMRLNNEIPKGYVVDEKKVRFVAAATAAPQASVPSPATTPAPPLPAPRK